MNRETRQKKIWRIIAIVLFLALFFLSSYTNETEKELNYQVKINQENIQTYNELLEYTRYLENLILNESIVYEDLYINIDDIGKENATIYTKDEWLK